MKKIKDMTIKEIEAEIQSNEAKREELHKAKEPIDRNLAELYNRNQRLEDQITRIKANSKTIDWGWLLSENGYDGIEKYNLRNLNLNKIGLSSSVFFHNIQQVQVRVMLKKNDPKSLPTTLKGLKKILKYIKPVENGWKQIDIFEHYLSEYGFYTLLIKDAKGSKDGKDDIRIQVTRHHRKEILHKFDNLEDALKKIQDKYYYEDLEEVESY